MTSYAEQLAQHEAFIVTLNENIKLGQELKTVASNIINSLDVSQADAGELATLIKAATDAAIKGAKLEADSRRERGKLLNSKPLEF